jgi:hypothetical protein
MHTFPARVAGTVRLDGSTYEAIDRDRNATQQAAIIVTIVAVAGGLAAWSEFGLPEFFIGVVLSYTGWVLFSAVAYAVGTSILAGEATEAEAEFSGVLRTVGFAQAPDLLLVFAVVPGGVTGGLISLAGSVWVIVCSVVALHISLRVSIPRAILISLIAAVVSVLFGAVVLALL